MVTCALGETVSGMSELRLTPGDAVADAHVIELPAGATPDPERLGAALVTATDALRVESVQEGGPAARAGLEAGDLVTAIAGAPTAGARQLAAFAYLSLAPGRVELTVRRGGEELALRLP
jgi:S1-C subfamily serine protease